MFGTLVIQLPTEFTGGELVVYHSGKEKTFKFDGLEGCMNFHYTAFYADCQHEIKPVTTGYRLCLVYNLVYRGSGTSLAPPENSLIIDRVVTAMKEWSQMDSAAPKEMVYLLEHKYSPATLSFNELKNLDRAVASVLLEARKRVDFDVYLAQLHVSQHWSGWCCGYDVDEDGPESEYISVSGFVAPGKHTPAIQHSVMIDRSVIVPHSRFELNSPDKEESEETGNAGVSVDRLYKMTVLVLWPVKRQVAMLGFEHTIKQLKGMIGGGSLTETMRKKYAESARGIVEQASRSSTLSASSASTLIHCLRLLGETKLVHQFFTLGASRYIENCAFQDQILTLCQTLSVEDSKPLLAVVARTTHHFELKHCKFLARLFEIAPVTPSPTDFLSALKETVQSLISKPVASPQLYFNRYNLYRDNDIPTDSVVEVIQALLNTKESELILEFLLAVASVSSERIIQSSTFQSIVVKLASFLGWTAPTPAFSTLFEKLVKHTSGFSSLCSFVTLLYDDAQQDAENKVFCGTLLNVIISNLSTPTMRDIPVDSVVAVFQALLNAKETELLLKLLLAVASATNAKIVQSIAFKTMVLKIAGVLGSWVALTPIVTTLTERLSKFADATPSLCSFVTFLHEHSQQSSLEAEQKALCVTLLNIIISNVCNMQSVSVHYVNGTILCLLQLAVTLDSKESLAGLMTAFLQKPQSYPLLTVATAVMQVYEKAVVEKRGIFHPALSSCISKISTECAKPEPKGRSKKAIGEREVHQKLRQLKASMQTAEAMFASASTTSKRPSEPVPIDNHQSLKKPKVIDLTNS